MIASKMSKYSLLALAVVMATAWGTLFAADTKPADGLGDGTPDNVAKPPPTAGTAPSDLPQPTTSPAEVKGTGLFGGNNLPLVFIAVAFLGLMMWQSRSRKKQEAKRRDLLNSLQKGSKITTIGGIIGTVIEVRENEVTVKTDESNNVRMKFARWAIRDVGEPAKGDMEPEKK